MTLLLLAILLPLIGGAALPLFRFQQERPRSLYVEAVVLVTSALTWWAIGLSPEGELPLLRMTDTLTLTLHLDGMSKVFAGLCLLHHELWRDPGGGAGGEPVFPVCVL